MKKLVAMMLTGAMMVSLGGCAKEVPPATGEAVEGTENESVATTELVPEEGAELTYWALRKDFALEAAAKFEELYGIPVTVEEVGFDSIQKLNLEGPAGNAADVVWGSHQAISEGYHSGMFLKINEQVETRLRDNIQESALKAAEIEGDLYGIPLYMESIAMYYNKDLVDTPAETFEEIIEIAPTYTNQSENKFYFNTALTGYMFYPYLSAAGFELHGANGTDNDVPGYDTPEYLEGLRNIEAIGEIIPIASGDLRMDGAQFVTENFAQGKTAYMLGGPWDISTIKEGGVNYGITTLPTLGGEEAKPFAGVTMNYINSYTEYPIAAQLFAEFMTTIEMAEVLFETEGDIPVHKNGTSIESVASNEDISVFIEQFESTVPQPAVSRMSYYWTISDNVFSLVFDGEMTPEEAQAKSVADYEALVASE